MRYRLFSRTQTLQRGDEKFCSHHEMQPNALMIKIPRVLLFLPQSRRISCGELETQSQSHTEACDALHGDVKSNPFGLMLHCIIARFPRA